MTDWQTQQSPWKTQQAPAHCWENGPEILTGKLGDIYPEYVGTTCMLPSGHEGEHEFRRNDSFLVVVG